MSSVDDDRPGELCMFSKPDGEETLHKILDSLRHYHTDHNVDESYSRFTTQFTDRETGKVKECLVFVTHDPLLIGLLSLGGTYDVPIRRARRRHSRKNPKKGPLYSETKGPIQ